MEPVPTSHGARRANTIRDVARHAGVGVGTVSRVLNGGERVSAETLDRVQAAIRELGYRPSAAARALSRGVASAIGVTAPHLTSPSVVARLRGVVDTLGNNSYDIGLATVETASQRERRMKQVCQRDHLNGLIVISLHPTAEERRQLIEGELPVVFLDVAPEGFPSVDIDNTAGGRIATEHLLEFGHTELGFIGDLPEPEFEFTSSARRLTGFLDACAAAGVGQNLDWVMRVAHAREAAAVGAEAMLRGAKRPTAIFAASDTQALGVLDAARRLGLSVPGDLSVMGFDDLEFAELVGLSTVHQPLVESGRCAADLLLSRMSGDGTPQDDDHVVLPLHLEPRGTTGPPPARSTHTPAGKRGDRPTGHHE